MTDEEKAAQEAADKAAQGAVPAFDPEKMRTLIREELQQHMSTEGKDDAEVRFEQPTDRGPQPTVNPLQAIIDPIMAPHIQRATLAAEGARDAATFYISTPEAVKYQVDLEKAFSALMAQGTPFTRKAVWDWYKGQNFDKFLSEARAEDAKKVEEAKQNADGGSGQRPGGGPVKNAHDASDDELKNALNGVSF